MEWVEGEIVGKGEVGVTSAYVAASPALVVVGGVCTRAGAVSRAPSCAMSKGGSSHDEV